MTEKQPETRNQATKEALIDALEKGFASGRSRRTLEEVWQAAKRKALAKR